MKTSRIFRRRFLSALAATAMLSGAMPTAATAETTIELLYPIAVGGPLEAVINGFVADFEAEHPDIKVNAVYAGGYSDVVVAARIAVEAGDPPAVAVMEATNMYEFLDGGMIIPFDDFVQTAEEKQWLNGFYPGFMENSRDPEGKTWGIPFQRSTGIQVWNKELFKEAGLDPDHAPQTWDEVVQIASQVQQNTDVPWGIGIHSSSSWMMQSLAIENGVIFSSPDGKSVNFSDPAAIEAMKWYADLSCVLKVQAPGVINYGTLHQAFMEGKFAIAWQSTGSLTGLRKGAPFEFGVAMLPANKRRGAAAGGGNLYIFADRPEAEQRAAFEFVRFLTQPEQSAKWTLASGYIAPTPEAWETEQLKNYLADFPGGSVAREQLEFTERGISTYQQGRIYVGLLNKAVQEAVTCQNEPEVIMNRIQKEADSILAPYQ